MHTMFGYHPTLEVAPVEDAAAAATHMQILRHALLRAGHRHDDLEDRARRQLRLDSLVEQRMRLIGQQPMPLFRRDPHGKFIGVERRTAHHCQDVAGARIHRDHRAVLAFERLFRRLLDVQIDRRLQRVAGICRFVRKLADFPALRIHQHAALPVRAHEHIVVPLFQPRLPHHSARFIHLKFRTIQHRLADFTDISDRMRCKPILRIEPSAHAHHFEHGQFIPMRLDVRELVEVHLIFHDDGSSLRARTADPLPHLLEGHVQRIGILGIISRIQPHAVILAQQ